MSQRFFRKSFAEVTLTSDERRGKEEAGALLETYERVAAKAHQSSHEGWTEHWQGQLAAQHQVFYRTRYHDLVEEARSALSIRLGLVQVGAE